MSYLDDIYSMTDDTFEDNLSWCFAVAHVISHETAETDILNRMQWSMQWSHGAAVLGCFDDFDIDRAENDPEYRENLEWPESEILWAFRNGTVSEDDLLAFAEKVDAKDREYRANGAEL